MTFQLEAMTMPAGANMMKQYEANGRRGAIPGDPDSAAAAAMINDADSSISQASMSRASSCAPCQIGIFGPRFNPPRRRLPLRRAGSDMLCQSGDSDQANSKSFPQ